MTRPAERPVRTTTTKPKAYDRRYFNHWYRNAGIHDRAALARKVALAVSVAEYHLGRPVRTALDIGAGEGAWRAPLLRLRSDLKYLGFDSSEYAVARYGTRRNLHLAKFADFAQLRPCPPVDLLICSDVLHYLTTAEINRGLPGLAALCGGVAYLETWTRDDAFEGDCLDFKPRSAAFYRTRFQRVGFRALGTHCWLSPAILAGASALELTG
ncbi:MAG: class I SAM-dependent methyltransferase [Lysobacterales bacterium]